jgi:DNA polymerase-1
LLHTWLLTANNPIFDTQTARRIVRSRLDPRVDRPWLRAADSFRHPDLRAWALENRGELMWAVLVLIQAWLDQGRPPGKATLGSYESWARVVGGILSNAGIKGFLGNVHQLYERADTEGATWRALVAKWWDTFKDTAVGTSDLYPLALALDTFNFGKATTERGQRTVLGQKLAQQEDRVIGDYRVVPADREHNTQQWRLEFVGQGPSGDSQGDSSKESPKSPPVGRPPEGSREASGTREGAPGRQETANEGTVGTLGDSFALSDGEKTIFQSPDGTADSPKTEKISLDGDTPERVPQSPHSPPTACSSAGVSLDTPQIHMVTSHEHLERALPELLAAPVLGLDTETTGLDPLSDEIRLVQLATPDAVYVVDSFKVDVRALRPLFESGHMVLGHNLCFDLSFLERAGLPVPNGETLFDTQLATKLLGAGKNGFAPYGLAAAAQRFLDIELRKDHQTSDWTGELSTEQLRYAARDALVLFPLYERLVDELTRAGMVSVALLEMEALPCVVWLRLTGAPFDQDAWCALSDGAVREQIELEQQLTAASGAADLFGGRALNWASVPQVLKVLRARGHEVASTREEVLRGLADGGDAVAALLLRYREASKRVGTYGIGYLQHVHQRTGRIHADYDQIGSTAGRFSCSRPNLQQVPRTRAYRACFRPAPGRVLVKADLSQVELRAVAQIAPELRMIAAFERGEDLHTLTARAVRGTSRVTKQDRQAAKAINFGLVYGMGAERLRQNARDEYGVDLSPEEALAAKKAFFAAYPGIKDWHRCMPENPVDTHTLMGRRRMGVTNFTDKCNTPVQGSAADGLKAGLALLWQTRERVPGACPALCVHDELVIECDEDRAEQAKEWLVDCMVRGMSAVVDKVPIEVEAAICRDWSATEDS